MVPSMGHVFYTFTDRYFKSSSYSPNIGTMEITTSAKRHNTSRFHSGRQYIATIYTLSFSLGDGVTVTSWRWDLVEDL